MRRPRFAGYGLSALVLILAVALTAAAPLVEITKPRSNEIVSGVADIEVTYTSMDATPIVRLEVFISNRRVQDYRLETPQTQGRQAFRWDFTNATAGMYTISARAMDANGTAGTAGIKVTVRRRAPGVTPAVGGGGADNTPPTVDIFYPAENAVVSGKLQVKADAQDTVGVRTVVFYLDGKFKVMRINSPNYSFTTDTTELTDGVHVVAVKAFDEADNEGSAERTFIVQNTQATTTGTADDRIGRAADGTGTPVQPDIPKPPLPSTLKLDQPTQGETQPVMPGAGEADMVPLGTEPPDLKPPTVSVAPVPASLDLSTSSGAAPAASGAAAMSDVSAGAPAQPRSTTPMVVKLPKSMQPPPGPAVLPEAPQTTVKTVVPEARPTTSGLVAKLGPASAGTLAPAAEPVAATSRPLAGEGPELKIARPPSKDAVMVAKLYSDFPARPVAPVELTSMPKTAAIGRDSIVQLAPASAKPATVYASDPVGEPRPVLVAALPARSDEEPTSKLGAPRETLDVAAMSRFRDVKIVFDGKLIPLRAAPGVVDGISVAPLREIFEGCDGVLYWSHPDKRVTAVNPDIEMNLQIGNPVATVNGADEALVLAPFIKKGRTMLPLEFVASNLDVTISFNSSTGELIICSKDN